jgi:hypothetical protein
MLNNKVISYPVLSLKKIGDAQPSEVGYPVTALGTAMIMLTMSSCIEKGNGYAVYLFQNNQANRLNLINKTIFFPFII